MRLFLEDVVGDPWDWVDADHSSLLPCDIIAGSVHDKFIHRSLDGTNILK